MSNISKKMIAPVSTETYNRNELDKDTGNIYQSIALVGKRANQIAVELKAEIREKLDQYAHHTEMIEEVFENKEQIEASRVFERLPKPTSVAIKEFLDGKIKYKKIAEPIAD